MAGPFDRYCGFCGHDLAEGEPRSSAWRFWLLVAMVPMVAGLVVGATMFGGPAVHTVGNLVFRPAPAATATPAGPAVGRALRSQNLHLEYVVPAEWSPFDYTLSAVSPLQLVVVSRIQADGAKFGDTKGDIFAARPQSVLMTLGKPGAAPPGADATDPSSVLGADISSLTLKPPAGFRVDVFRQAQTISVNSRTGKEVVLKLTRADGSISYLERAYLTGPSGLFQVDALVPAADWEAGDDRRVETVIQSIRLTA